MAKDCREQIDCSRKRLANCLNLLEAIHNELEYVFEQRPDWNSEIQWQMDEATVKLGFALATLTNWYDDDDENKN